MKDADFVYVKNWSSYDDYGKIIPVENDWMLTSKNIEITNNAKVMHCLPVRRNVELSDEILDSENSIVTRAGGQPGLGRAGSIVENFKWTCHERDF